MKKKKRWGSAWHYRLVDSSSHCEKSPPPPPPISGASPPPLPCSCFHKTSHLRLPIKPQGCKRRKAQEESIAVLICLAWNSKQAERGRKHPQHMTCQLCQNTAPVLNLSGALNAGRNADAARFESNARDLHARFSSFLQSGCHLGETTVLWLKRLKARRSCARCLVLWSFLYGICSGGGGGQHQIFQKSREQWPHLSLNAM